MDKDKFTVDEELHGFRKDMVTINTLDYLAIGSLNAEQCGVLHGLAIEFNQNCQRVHHKYGLLYSV